jgi:parvulin-like peptidyl-prolyl isomerase
MKSVPRLLAAMVALVMLSAVLTGCGAQNVATVNGQGIPLSDLQQQFANVKQQYPQMFAGADAAARQKDFAKRLLDNLIDQQLVAQYAQQNGITVDETQITKQLAQLKSQFKDDKTYQDALKKFGTTEDKLKEQIRQQLLLQAVTAKLAKSTAITDAEIKAYYDKNKAQFTQTAGKRVSHILVAAKDKALADSILKQVQGGADFASLAKKYSIDQASATKGGDLGWPTTPYVPEFQAAVDKLKKVGQVSGVVKSTYGYHIIKLEEIRTAKQKTLAEVSAQIKQILVQQKQADSYQKFVAGLRAKYKDQIKIDQGVVDSMIAAAGSSTTTATGK